MRSCCWCGAGACRCRRRRRTRTGIRRAPSISSSTAEQKPASASTISRRGSRDSTSAVALRPRDGRPAARRRQPRSRSSCCRASADVQQPRGRQRQASSRWLLHRPSVAGSLAFVPGEASTGRERRETSRTDANTILFHEYAHHLMFQDLARPYPQWLCRRLRRIHVRRPQFERRRLGRPRRCPHSTRAMACSTGRADAARSTVSGETTTRLTGGGDRSRSTAAAGCSRIISPSSRRAYGQLDRYLDRAAQGTSPLEAAAPGVRRPQAARPRSRRLSAAGPPSITSRFRRTALKFGADRSHAAQRGRRRQVDPAPSRRSRTG